MEAMYLASEYSFRMKEERHHRLRQARIDAGYETAADVARHFKWKSYQNNESGTAPFSFKAAVKYASGLNVNAEWLYHGTGPKHPGSDNTDHNRERSNRTTHKGIVQPPLLTVTFLGHINKMSRLSPGGDVMEESKLVELGALPPDVDVFEIAVDAGFTGPGLPGGSIFIADFDHMPPLNGDRIVLRITRGDVYRYVAAVLEVTVDGDNRYWDFATGAAPIEMGDNEEEWVIGKIIEYRLLPGPVQGRAAKRQSNRKTVHAA